MPVKIVGRYIEDAVRNDLSDRMVFIGGPRQVGKTTFALSFLKDGNPSHRGYRNWDDLKTRTALMKGELPPEEPVVILDEIHKFARWRNLVKGFFDTMKGHTSFIITGSARLDYYRKGGDSLHGRYQYYRLHPFSLSELDPDCRPEALLQLLTFGGFPEPLFKADATFARRWRRQRNEKIIHNDIRDLEAVREISLIELLSQELPSRVGAPLSIRNLCDQLQVAHQTVAHWLDILERMYVCFRVSPYGGKRIRAVKKEQKMYMWDWAEVSGDGERFENLVACTLLKYCHFIEDTQGHEMALRYLRDTDRREVDFVVLKDGKPQFAVECKRGAKSVNPNILYFSERTEIPVFYQVHLEETDFVSKGIRVMPFATFCRELKLP